ncbi:MAG: thiosulfate oxidation carrier protein SoxY [Acidiferrobacterales bacterium]|nr:thiosulfate oxidation carrier protein SoxY [Acidiferrobacterales bacterium]
MKTLEKQRRKVLKGALATSLVALAASWGMLGSRAFAARPQMAFDADDLGGTLKALFGEDAIEDSGDIIVKGPEIAENGAVVPIKVTAKMNDVQSIAILVPENPAPMVASFDLDAGIVPEVSVRIKMGKTSDVIALVRSNGKVYRGAKEVKVTIGGCGG